MEPALVAEDHCAELNHLTVKCVVRWDISDQLGIPWLDIRNHQEMHVDSLLKLGQVESHVLNRGLVVAITIPDSPLLLLSFIDEVPNVVIGAISEHLQELKFSLGSRICLHSEALGTVDDVLRHSHL